MNDFDRLNELIAELKADINGLYGNLDKSDTVISQALKISGLKESKSAKTAVIRRLADLKVEPLENELKKQGKSQDEINAIKADIYEFTREFYEKRFGELLKKIKSEKILDDFNLALVEGAHDVGLAVNAWQPVWEKQILLTTNKEFETKFPSIADAIKFIDENGLYQKDGGQKCERSYGAVVKDGDALSFKPYAAAFMSETKIVLQKLDSLISRLEILAQTTEQKAYVEYFKKLKEALSQKKNDRTISAWQDAERAWMEVKSPLQIGHPLEYYEDAYTHAVALEWDVRLNSSNYFNETEFKSRIIKSYERICLDIGVKNEKLDEQVVKNVSRTQIYICVPMLYYGAELNGLFSAQVVPNDETVSKECGKKIFAFVNHVYESAKARPFMKLSGEIFSSEFLNYGREILFKKPEVWRKVYEISTIGHEFGHILFIDVDTEKTMNKDGEFKFIEEYKATTGGLVNFFLHELSEYKMPVFHELIVRAVGLVAWRKVDEVRAYYCEGLIHLSLLFKASVLSFENGKLSVDFSEAAYENFKKLCLDNYRELAGCYVEKIEAGEFLAKFCEKDGKSYLPKDEHTKRFTLYYHELYESIGNEIDESGEWEKWKKC
jgi:signal peptidase II